MRELHHQRKNVFPGQRNIRMYIRETTRPLTFLSFSTLPVIKYIQSLRKTYRSEKSVGEINISVLVRRINLQEEFRRGKTQILKSKER